MANALADVQDTFTSLDANYKVLWAACRTDDDRTALEQKYSDAQKAYQTCVGEMLADDDEDIADLSVQLKTANDEVKQAVAEMGNMSKVLDNLTTAISIGAKLITAAGL